MNLNVPFFTPEEFFLGDKPAKFLLGAFNPTDYIPTANEQPTPLFKARAEQEVIVFVGSPASGKSTFFRENLEGGYVRINQDTLKTRERCIAEATTHLTEKKSIVIGTKVPRSPKKPPSFAGNDSFFSSDNTNADKATRKIWLDLASTFNLPTRCIHFTASPALARHNNLVRALGGVAVEKRRLLPASAIYMFAARYEEPRVEEGFEEVVKVAFRFRGTGEEEETWRMWWD
jgi:bifunctional polynucleotide phosphatase/kinase